MGRKKQSGSSGQPADGNENITGSKRVRDSGDKSGLTPDEKVTKNVHGKNNLNITNENNDSIGEKHSSSETNDTTYAKVVRGGQDSGSANSKVVKAVASVSAETPGDNPEPETNEQEGMETNTNPSCTNYRDSHTTGSESEEDLNPLSEEAEEQLRQENDPMATLEPAPKKAKTFAEATKQKAYEILYVQKGTKERMAIEKDVFYKLMDKYQSRSMDKVFEDITFPNKLLWHSWKDGRGLVAVGDKETSDYFIKELSVIKVGKDVFRAWHRDQVSEGKLVSVWLAGNGYARFKPEHIIKALKKQNDLEGQATGAKFKGQGKNGKLLIFFADKNLWAGLLARSTSATGGKAVLRLGSFQVVAQLSRDAPTVEALSLEGTDDTTRAFPGVKAGCSKD